MSFYTDEWGWLDLGVADVQNDNIFLSVIQLESDQIVYLFNDCMLMRIINFV